MSYIVLRSGEKIWMESWLHSTSLDHLVLSIDGNTPHTVESLRVIKEMGNLAAEALPDLQCAVKTQSDRSVTELIEEVCAKIKGEEIALKREKVDVEIVQVGGDIKTNAEVYQKCNFCDKEALVQKDVFTDRLCPPDRFYCRFCLRHNYNHRDNRHILMLSMRGVIGYYFWQFYYGPPKPYMWLSEIKDYIALHEEVGLRNPVFNYDPETLIWFVDFRRVGDSKKKLPMQEVKRTIVEMLTTFNMHIHVKGLGLAMFYEKYASAVDEFYHKRHRPEGRRHLIPTFKGCGNIEWGQCSPHNQWVPPICAGNKLSIEDTKGFTISLLRDHLWNKTSSS